MNKKHYLGFLTIIFMLLVVTYINHSSKIIEGNTQRSFEVGDDVVLTASAGDYRPFLNARIGNTEGVRGRITHKREASARTWWMSNTHYLIDIPIYDGDPTPLRAWLRDIDIERVSEDYRPPEDAAPAEEEAAAAEAAAAAAAEAADPPPDNMTGFSAGQVASMDATVLPVRVEADPVFFSASPFELCNRERDASACAAAGACIWGPIPGFPDGGDYCVSQDWWDSVAAEAAAEQLPPAADTANPVFFSADPFEQLPPADATTPSTAPDDVPWFRADEIDYALLARGGWRAAAVAGEEAAAAEASAGPAEGDTGSDMPPIDFNDPNRYDVIGARSDLEEAAAAAVAAAEALIEAEREVERLSRAAEEANAVASQDGELETCSVNGKCGNTDLVVDDKVVLASRGPVARAQRMNGGPFGDTIEAPLAGNRSGFVKSIGRGGTPNRLRIEVQQMGQIPRTGYYDPNELERITNYQAWENAAEQAEDAVEAAAAAVDPDRGLVVVANRALEAAVAAEGEAIQVLEAREAAKAWQDARGEEREEREAEEAEQREAERLAFYENQRAEAEQRAEDQPREREEARVAAVEAERIRLENERQERQAANLVERRTAAAIIAYENEDKSGWEAILPGPRAAGDPVRSLPRAIWANYVTQSLIDRGAKDNEISSLIINPGYLAELFDTGDISGAMISLTEGEWRQPQFEDDSISSLRIRKTIPKMLTDAKNEISNSPDGNAGVNSALITEIVADIDNIISFANDNNYI